MHRLCDGQTEGKANRVSSDERYLKNETPIKYDRKTFASEKNGNTYSIKNYVIFYFMLKKSLGDRLHIEIVPSSEILYSNTQFRKHIWIFR